MLTWADRRALNSRSEPTRREESSAPSEASRTTTSDTNWEAPTPSKRRNRRRRREAAIETEGFDKDFHRLVEVLHARNEARSRWQDHQGSREVEEVREEVREVREEVEGVRDEMRALRSDVSEILRMLKGGRENLQ
jgi:hypothetical protein